MLPTRPVSLIARRRIGGMWQKKKNPGRANQGAEGAARDTGFRRSTWSRGRSGIVLGRTGRSGGVQRAGAGLDGDTESSGAALPNPAPRSRPDARAHTAAAKRPNWTSSNRGVVRCAHRAPRHLPRFLDPAYPVHTRRNMMARPVDRNDGPDGSPQLVQDGISVRLRGGLWAALAREHRRGSGRGGNGQLVTVDRPAGQALRR